MNCHNAEFSPGKSEQRINRALKVFPKVLLMRLLAFVLHLLGLKRKEVAELVDMPEESVKTVVRLALRDGFSALRDRRRRPKESSVGRTEPSPPQIDARRDGEWYEVEFGPKLNSLRIPITFTVQARTVLLSLVNAELLPAKKTATILGISAGHCRELARKLASHDVVESLIDKRHGQKQDYRMGLEQKAEVILQLAARAMTGHATSSSIVADVVNERTQGQVTARTVRWHVLKLGLTRIKETLPKLVETLKKTS